MRMQLNIGNYDEAIKDVMNTPAGEYNQRLYEHSRAELVKSVQQVYGTPKYGDAEYEAAKKMERNVTQFSALKSAEYTSLIKGGDEENRPISLATYERHLVTEKNLAVRTARAAKEWDKIQRGKERFPNLEYLPSRSANQRKDHQQYYRMVLPVDHPFWNKGFPPNGYNCKCGVRPTRAEPTKALEPPKLPKGIPGNAGKGQEVFTKSHAHFSRKKVIAKQFNRAKEELPFDEPDIKLKNGSSVSVHTYAEPNTKKLKENVEAATVVAKNIPKTKIELMPHTDTGSYKTGKNPDYRINGVIGDLSYATGASALGRVTSAVANKYGVQKGKPKQLQPYKESVLVVNLTGSDLGDKSGLANQIKGKMDRIDKIKSIILINEDNAVRIERGDNVLEKVNSL